MRTPAVGRLPRDARTLGVSAAVGSQLLYGLAYLVPELLAAVSAVEVTFGRFLVHGLLSIALLATLGAQARAALDASAWRTALTFAAAGNVGYYLCVVIGVQLAGAPLTAVIIGALPVTIVVASALRGEVALAPLRLPLALVAAGLALVNLVGITQPGEREAGEVALGALAATGGLALWTWYARANAAFLRARPDVGAPAWSVAVGLATLGIVALATGPLLALTGGELTASRDVAAYLAGALVLGVLVSWLAGLLWNQAAVRIPVALAGQLIVLETLAGLTYAYLARTELPALPSVIGIALLVAGVLLGVRRTLPRVSPVGAAAITERGARPR